MIDLVSKSWPVCLSTRGTRVCLHHQWILPQSLINVKLFLSSYSHSFVLVTRNSCLHECKYCLISFVGFWMTKKCFRACREWFRLKLERKSLEKNGTGCTLQPTPSLIFHSLTRWTEFLANELYRKTCLVPLMFSNYYHRQLSDHQTFSSFHRDWPEFLSSAVSKRSLNSALLLRRR